MIDPSAKTWAAAAAAAFHLLACQESQETAGNNAAEAEPSQTETKSQPQKTEAEPGKPAADSKTDKECCIGKNDCKGKGGCAVEGKHACAGKNDCKGQGGCNMHCPK
jgi:hypothetical protein